MPGWAQMVAVAMVVAGVSPVVTALVIQWHFPSWVKTVVGLLIAGSASFVAVGQTTGYPSTLEEWSAFIVAVVLATQTAYRGLWKPANIEVLERKTSGKAAPAGTYSAGK